MMQTDRLVRTVVRDQIREVRQTWRPFGALAVSVEKRRDPKLEQLRRTENTSANVSVRVDVGVDRRREVTVVQKGDRRKLDWVTVTKTQTESKLLALQLLGQARKR